MSAKTSALRKILLYFFLLLFTKGGAQSLHRPLATSYISLGAYSLHHVDVFSVAYNQALLAQIKEPTAGLYGEKRFLLAETNRYSSIVAVPTKEGNFAFQADYFGNKDYNESQLGIAYARQWAINLILG